MIFLKAKVSSMSVKNLSIFFDGDECCTCLLMDSVGAGVFEERFFNIEEFHSCKGVFSRWLRSIFKISFADVFSRRCCESKI